jgi:hypothetical protein
MKISTLIALLFLSASAAAGVYKWTDEAGHVHYSDKPPETAAEKLDIETRRTDPEQLTARLSQDENRQEAAGIDPAEQERLEQREREQQMRRQENCQRAQKALASLLSATRVYEPLPGGERRYLEQDEIDQRKADAQADVDQWCNGSQ